MQAGQCVNQKGTKFWKLLCDEHCIGGDGEYCGNNDKQLGRIYASYGEASSGKHEPRAMLLDLEPARSALCARDRSASSSARATS
jgi:tubulin beta